MKFTELKNTLKDKVENVYVVYGDDFYLQNNAVQLIEKALKLSMPEINKMFFDEGSFNFDSVFQNLKNVPFFDQKRLVVIKNINYNDTKSLINSITKATKDLEYNVVVFQFSQVTELCKKLFNVFTVIDCSKLEEKHLKTFIARQLNISTIKITENALNLLINYCSFDLTKISVEINKLISIGEQVLDTAHIEEYVVPDKEYQIYELTDKLASGDHRKVYEIFGNLFSKDKNSVGLIQYIYSSFRRILYVSLSANKTDVELSSLLNVKPYAIKMARQTAKKFTIKQLKKIIDELSKLEFCIKSGKINQDIAVHLSLSNILLMRNE